MDNQQNNNDLADDAAAHLQRGAQLRHAGDYAAAIAELSIALQLAPSADGYIERGQAYAATDDFAAAVADFGAAIAIDPSADNYSHRGFAYLALAQPLLGRADFSAAIAINPHDDLAYYGRALTCYTSGDLEAAIADFRTALRQTSSPELLMSILDHLKALGVDEL